MASSAMRMTVEDMLSSSFHANVPWVVESFCRVEAASMWAS